GENREPPGWQLLGPSAARGGVPSPANATISRKNPPPSFVGAGSYPFPATVSDGSQSVSSSVTVTVNQTLTHVQISPATATVPDGATQQFSASALDQFGAALATQPAFTWSIDAGGLGKIGTNGLYTAPPTRVRFATVPATN